VQQLLSLFFFFFLSVLAVNINSIRMQPFI
jgi:hypothetical protein